MGRKSVLSYAKKEIVGAYKILDVMGSGHRTKYKVECKCGIESIKSHRILSQVKNLCTCKRINTIYKEGHKYRSKQRKEVKKANVYIPKESINYWLTRAWV